MHRDHGGLRLWNLTGAEPREGATLTRERGAGALAYTPGGGWLASAWGDHVTLWNAATGRAVREWDFPGDVPALAFATDGRHLAVACANTVVYILRLAAPPEAGP